MAKSLQESVVIVTGAGRGIGRSIAERFGKVGATVAVNDIDAETATRVANTITSAGGSAAPVPADVADHTQVTAMFTYVMDKWGSLDILINNAGLVSPMLHFLEADETWWRKIIDVNLTGHFLTSQQAAKIMAKQGYGTIIHMSSGGATRAHRSFSAYDASKGGIEALTRAMALDLGPYGIRVCALVPGAIDTQGLGEESRRLREDNIPLGRIGEPDDIAGPALFLASDDARYITGVTLTVDGGMLAQQRSASTDIMPPSSFPSTASLHNSD